MGIAKVTSTFSQIKNNMHVNVNYRNMNVFMNKQCQCCVFVEIYFNGIFTSKQVTATLYIFKSIILFFKKNYFLYFTLFQGVNTFLAPLTIVRRSLSDTNLSVVRRPTSTFSNRYFSYIQKTTTRKLISSSSFHRLDMTLAVAEALHPNKPKPL